MKVNNILMIQKTVDLIDKIEKYGHPETGKAIVQDIPIDIHNYQVQIVITRDPAEMLKEC